MSYIFDALQRSETERSGIELDAFDLPTELLQMSETAVTVKDAEPQSAVQGETAELKALVPELAESPGVVPAPSSMPVFASVEKRDALRL